jgi:hypothetical protein
VVISLSGTDQLIFVMETCCIFFANTQCYLHELHLQRVNVIYSSAHCFAVVQN